MVFIALPSSLSILCAVLYFVPNSPAVPTNSAAFVAAPSATLPTPDIYPFAIFPATDAPAIPVIAPFIDCDATSPTLLLPPSSLNIFSLSHLL